MASITNLTAIPTQNAGELTISWTRGSGVIAQRLLMSGSRYAMTSTDGEILYEGLEETYTVSNLLPERYYYFTLYINTGSGLVTYAYCKVAGLTIAIKDFSSYNCTGFGEYLYRLLPYMYKLRDKETDLSLPLKRFLALFGAQIDHLYSRINCAKNVLTDIDKTSDEYMYKIAEYLGWDLNKELPIDRQRMELKGVYEFYKNKGTKTGVVEFITAISGMFCRVLEFRNLVLKTVPTDTLGKARYDASDIKFRTMDTTAAGVAAYNAVKQTYENIYPVINNVSRTGEWYQYRLNSIGVFIYGDATTLTPSGLTQAQIEAKAEKMWRKMLPVGMDGYIIWEQLKNSESLSVDDYYRTVLVDFDQWIKSNTTGKKTNTAGILTPKNYTEGDRWT